MRLDKYLANSGIGTRKEVKNYIKNKLVKVDGIIIKDAGFNVNDNAIVTINDETIAYQKYFYYMLHKPKDYLCANEDSRHATVFELLDVNQNDLFTVGRLDIDTEGLLLITNDGELTHRLIAPKYHVEKRYLVCVDNALATNAKELLEAPMDLGDFITKGGEYEQIDDFSAYLTIEEGKFHQVKRMFEKIGSPLNYLKRVSFAFLELEDLALGEYRELTSKEVQKLYDLVNLEKD